MCGLQAILNDDRVKAAREAGRGGRVRDEEETAAAGSLTPAGDGRKEASAVAAGGQKSAGEWIESWRERQGAGKE